MSGRYGVTSLGPFDGRLSNDGETLELLNSTGVKQDEVDYQLGFPWPTIGDIPGRSIQLINPAFENDVGGNWRSALVTPGATNTVFATNAPPQMRQVNHSPEAPQPGQDVTITMKVTDPEGVSSVTLQYQLVNPGDYIAINNPRYATNWTTVPMHDDGLAGDATAGDGIYTAVLPGSLQTDRRLVRYRVTATDTLGSVDSCSVRRRSAAEFRVFRLRRDPRLDRRGPARRHAASHVQLRAAWTRWRRTILITTRQAHVDSQYIPGTTRFNGYGGQRLPVAWCAGVRRRGVRPHPLSRPRRRVALRDGQEHVEVRLQSRPRLRGPRRLRQQVRRRLEQAESQRHHPAGRLSGTAASKGLFESVGFKLFNLAGVAASNTNYVHFRIVENASESGTSQYTTDFQGLYLAVEQLDDNFLDEHDLPDGNLYKMENGTGVGGIGGESNNQGDYPQPDDSSDLIAFKTTYEGGPPETADWWKQNFNLDSYYNYRSIVEAIHHYDIAGGKNYFYYHNPETNKWETLPWDLDLTWANNMFGNGNEPFRSRVLAIPEFALDYRNRLREIRDLLYNSEQVGLLIDEMASFVYTPGQPSLVDADRAMWDYNPILVSSNVNPGKAGHGRFYAGGGGIPPTGSYAGMMQHLKNYVVSRGSVYRFDDPHRRSTGSDQADDYVHGRGRLSARRTASSRHRRFPAHPAARSRPWSGASPKSITRVPPVTSRVRNGNTRSMPPGKAAS